MTDKQALINIGKVIGVMIVVAVALVFVATSIANSKVTVETAPAIEQVEVPVAL